MLNLTNLNIDIEKAHKEHLEYFSCYVTKRLAGRSCQVSDVNHLHPDRPAFCKSIRRRTAKFAQIQILQNFVFAGHNLETILGGHPEELKHINV